MVFYQNKKLIKGLTFVETIIVLGIVTFIFGSLYFLWRPLDIFRKSRDARRINDLQIIDTTLKTLLVTERDINLGEENIIYTSLPDSTSTCANYNLVSVYPPFSYKCKPVSDYLKIDGNGWIPVNFTLGKILSISSLPVDPLNNKDYFYAYQVKNNRYKLTARLESKSYILKMANDGGFEPTLYEVGSDLFISSPHSGLVGYWNFDEASGTIAYDLSGYNNHGVLYSSTTQFDLHATSSCKIGTCLRLDGVDDYLNVTSTLFSFIVTKNGKYTLSLWVNNMYDGKNHQLFQYAVNSNDQHTINFQTTGKVTFEVYNGTQWKGTTLNIQNNVLNYLTAVFNGLNEMKLYLNAESQPISFSHYYGYPWNTLSFGRYSFFNNDWFYGYLDEIRLYNRALTEDEIKALYQASY